MLLELHANTNYLDKQILIERLENMGFRVVESDANILAVIAFLFYLSSLKIKLNYGIWLVCFGAVTQFRISYHDAFTSLNGMYQLLAIFIFTASALS